MIKLLEEIPIAHQDGRRIIREKELGYGACITYFEILSEQTLGNHYHVVKAEVFTLLEGAAVWRLQPVHLVDGQIKPLGEICEIRPVIGSPLAIGPFLAHSVNLTPGSKMVCLSTHPFESGDMLPYMLG